MSSLEIANNKVWEILARPIFGWRRLLAPKVLLISLFVFLTGSPPAVGQFDESNPGVYWRQERQLQKKFNRKRVRRRVIIQRPTRLIRRSRPRRGYTRTVPAAPKNVMVPDAGQNNAPTAAGIPPAPGENPSATEPAKKAVTPDAPPALRVAVIGDNLGTQLGRGLASAYEDTPQVEIVSLTKNNSGLVRSDYYDWVGEIKKLLADGKKIDVAVMMIGSNDRQAIRDENGVHSPRSEEWQKAYLSRIDTIAAMFKEKKIPLIWLGMPVMRNERLATDMVAFNKMYRDAVLKHNGIFVDIWSAFTDERNRFSSYGPDVNGQTVKLRLSDGIHFTKAGARKLAHFAAIDIKRIIDNRKSKKSLAPAIAARPAPGPDNSGKNDPARQANLPAPVVIPVRPAIGPVVPLTAPAVAPDGQLLGNPKAGKPKIGKAKTDVKLLATGRNLTSGQPVSARPGRADDFRWPRK